MKAIFVFAALLSVGFALPATRTLDEDLQDFVDLVPTEKLKEILYDHVANDEEFKSAIKYLKGSEWAELLQEVASKEEVQEFKQYLIDSGIDVDKIIAYIRDWINNVDVDASSAASRGLREFIDEIKEALPIDDIVALFYNKLQNSEDFQQFYAKISSEKAHALVEEVRALSAVQDLAARLLELGVDLKKALDFIYNLFGWE